MTSYQTGCQIVLLRHGHRQEIPQGSFGHDLTLTEKGKKSSLRLGKKLADILWGEIHSSPLIRCQETAEHFLKGAGQKLSIHLSPLLGDPGPFVFDNAKAGPFFLANTPYEIMQKLLARQNLPGMRTVEEGGRLFDAYLKTVSRFPCLMISHDIIIALLYAYFSKSTPQKFPDYLGGFSLYCGRLETLNLDRAKTPGFDDRKRVHIANMNPFTIVESREFSRRSKSKFQADRSINLDKEITNLLMYYNHPKIEFE